MKEMFKDRVKRDLKNTMEGEELTDVQKLVVTNEALKQLLLLEDPKISTVIKNYYDKQTELQTQSEKLTEQQDKTWNEIIKNCKDIYSSLMTEL